MAGGYHAHRMVRGYRHVSFRRSPRLRRAGAFDVIVVVFAMDVLGLADSGAGLLFAAVGVGAVVGLPIAFALTGRRLYRALTVGLVLWGMPLAVASVTPLPGRRPGPVRRIGVGQRSIDLGASPRSR